MLGDARSDRSQVLSKCFEQDYQANYRDATLLYACALVLRS